MAKAYGESGTNFINRNNITFINRPMNIKYYLNKAKGKIIRSIFHYQTKGVYTLPPDGEFTDASPVVLLSMLQESDLQIYLLAVKSMLRYLPINKVVIVCDPSLTSDSKTMIQKHVQKVEFLDAQDYRHEKIPSGGCWERLYAIAHLTKQHYVIQMDADILVLKSPEEVIASIKQNHAFILATEPDFLQLPVDKMTGIAQQWVKDAKVNNEKIHIQKLIESNISSLAKPLGYQFYTRGCAGFAGFSQGSLTPENILILSEAFYKKLGKQWESWGTEQFTSNLLLSNQESVTVLPIETYNSSNHYTEDFVLAHFIGTYRFASLQYMSLAQKMLKELTK